MEVIYLAGKVITLSPKAIQFKLLVQNWQEALYVTSKPLLNMGIIKKSYIDRMIASVNQYGPYIVIAPGIALGHARPGNDIRHTAIALATLDPAINFGNKINDPVDIVIILAASNNNDHLELLQKLVKFLNNSQNLAYLKSSSSDSDADCISRLINEGENYESI